MLYTTTNLVDSIVTRGQFPDSTNVKTISSPGNLLNLATEELRLKILPMMLDAGNEYYVRLRDIPVVAGQTDYPLSTRASGNVARSIRLINGQTDMPFRSLDRDLLPNYPGSGTPYGYFFENNNVVLYPPPLSSGPTIRERYFIRPSRLTLVSSCAQVASFDPVLMQAVVSSVPSSWGVGTVLDWISQDNPYACRQIDMAITVISGTTITFASLPSDAAISDYLSLAEYTCLPQLPEEFQPLLSQMVVVRVHDALGNIQAYQNAKAELKEMLTSAATLLTPRDQSHPKKIAGTNWRYRTNLLGFLR